MTPPERKSESVNQSFVPRAHAEFSHISRENDAVDFRRFGGRLPGVGRVDDLAMVRNQGRLLTESPMVRFFGFSTSGNREFPRSAPKFGSAVRIRRGCTFHRCFFSAPLRHPGATWATCGNVWFGPEFSICRFHDPRQRKKGTAARGGPRVGADGSAKRAAATGRAARTGGAERWYMTPGRALIRGAAGTG